MYPHRIRLRGPWTVTPTGGSPRRATHPCRWRDIGLAGFTGTARHARGFGLPRSLDAGETIWLCGDRPAESAEVMLNGESLGSAVGPFAFDVTTRLLPRNELAIDVTAADDSGGLPGDVWLEVRATAWLENVVRAADGSLTGRVAGTTDAPLDLYILMPGTPTAHHPVGIGPFAVPGSPGPVRLELVRGGVVWYCLDLAE